MASLSGGSVVWDLDVDNSKLSSGLRSAKADVERVGADIEGSIEGMSSGIVNAFKRAQGASVAFGGAILGIGTALVGITGFGVKTAAEIETARQGFVTLLGSTEKADAALAQIKKDARETPFEFSGLVKANQLLTQVTKDAPRSERLLLNVGKALAVAGKGGEELDNVIVNLQQIANTSKISELDIRQFGFSGINILELLADQYGVTKEAAGEMVKNSKDAFADLEAAFAKAGEGNGKNARAFIEQAGTFNQLRSNFSDVISQIAADVVTQTGIFDQVKRSIAGIVDTLSSIQPQIIQGIKDAFTFIQANGPVLVGILVGGLTPAFAALAVSIGSAVVALAPFLLAGAAIGLLIQNVVTQLGGWQAVSDRLTTAFTAFGTAFNTFVQPAVDRLGAVVSTQLLPALQRLWTLVSPVLAPALEFLGKLVGGVVIGALRLFIEVLIGVIEQVTIVSNNISSLIELFKSLPGKISSALSGVKDAIVRPFQDALNAVGRIFEEIKGKMDQINPFHRNSPSLIDNVRSGVGIIKDEFSSLKSLSFPSIAEAFPSQISNPNNSPSSSSRDPIATAQRDVSVVVNIGQVNDNRDAEVMSREIAFKAALT